PIAPSPTLRVSRPSSPGRPASPSRRACRTCSRRSTIGATRPCGRRRASPKRQRTGSPISAGSDAACARANHGEQGIDRSMLDKIKTLNQLAEIASEARNKGKKVVLAHGVFDILHVGHKRHLDIGKHHGDILIVTLTTDKYVNKGPDRPVF